MKTSVRLLTVAVLFGMTLSLAAQTITIVADEWCPYNCEPGSDAPGFAIEALATIFDNAGMKLDYQVIDNWDQAVEDARAGKYNGIIGAAKGDAPDFVFPAEYIADVPSCLFVRKGDSWRYTDDASLQSRTIAAMDGYDYNSPAIDDDTYGNVKRYETLEECVEALLSGEVDTFAEDELVYQLFEFKNHIGGEVVKAGCVESDPIYVAFSPANPKSKDYAQIVSKGIAAMRASGDWKALLEKYGLK